MAATTPKPLWDPTTLTAAAVTYYTVPAATTTIIKHLALHNTSSSPVQVTIYLVPSDGSAGVTNQIFKGSIAGLDSVQVYSAINGTLETGATIQALAATAGVVSFHGGGNEVI